MPETTSRLYRVSCIYGRQLTSDHKLKQGWFVSSFFDVFDPKDVLRRYQSIQSAKNNAIYAGVRRGNHQIVRPFLISASKYPHRRQNSKYGPLMMRL
jgi:hypothetical protein